ncbi:MAG: ATP-binding protein, partial [Bacteroidota bacterium]
NTVYCILEDDKGRLWMSTFKGLVYFDSATENIQVFNQYDGLLEPEFNRNSYAKDEDGRIYFGSLRGVTAFYPDEIVRTSDLEQPILMTQFLVYKKSDNQWQDLTEQLNKTQKIVLDPSDRFFKLSVSLLDFFNAERLRYHYKIDGLLDDFQLIKGNQLEVSGLPYGKYKLRIKGQGADGRFSNQELVLPLIVKRPFYLSWWFFLLVFCSLMMALYKTYLWRTKQLNERQQELELLVQERTAKIAAQAEQLKELDQVKSKFFANISHELRTPLTLIIGPIKKLLGSNNLSNKEYTSVLLMQQNSQKLLKRINELLDLSRLNANKMEVHTTPTYLYPFLKNIIISIDSIANAKDIQIQFNYHLSEGLQILLDTDKMEKILYNYLSNALKFTPTNGEIRVLAERVEEQLQISVSDTGIGIPKADLTKVFDRFYQSRAKNSSQSRLNANGTGIGLALCQELAKVLKGKVWATSKIGKGSTFFVQVPLTETFAIKAVDSIIEVEQAIPVLPKQTDFSTNRASILVVEDNLDLRQYLQLILEEQYDVQLVEHGQAALDWLEKEEHPLPELILSDIMMPVMDGIELLSIIKSKDQFRHIPMIILTARQSMEVKLNALRIGIDDYLTKPFDNVELQTRVQNLIENSRSRSAQESPQNETATPELSNTDLHWLEKVEQLILENVTESNFMLRDVATQMRMSYSGFRQRIKKITGLSPKQYERSIKLNKAREILKSGQVATVSEVLHQLGFDNHYHFSKIYKAEFGIMPSEELRR